MLSGIEAAALDLAVGLCLRERVRRNSDDLLRLAIDGKVLRGAWTDENDQFTLFSAMAHREGVTVAQAQVPANTNESTQVKALLDSVSARDGDRVIVTMDAATPNVTPPNTSPANASSTMSQRARATSPRC